MPHMFVNRPRLHNLTKGRLDLEAHFRWETINAVIYKVGGVLFIIGSLFFSPVSKRTPTSGPGPILSVRCSILS